MLFISDIFCRTLCDIGVVGTNNITIYFILREDIL